MAEGPNNKQVYERVNTAINDVLFDNRFSNKNLYLDIEGDVEEEISKNLNIDSSKFKSFLGRAVQGILFEGDLNSPYFFLLEGRKLWNKLDRTYNPPFTAFLCSLSLAAENMRADSEYSSNNYYERLFSVFEIEDLNKKKQIRNKAKETIFFWDSLNLWLRENEFIYGVPTAKKIGAHKFISLPISQALIRDSERQEFKKIFKSNGLRPYMNISIQDAETFIIDWIQKSQANINLKRLANTPTKFVRERLFTSFCEELENWEAQAESGISSADNHTKLLIKTISLMFVKRSRPIPKIDLRLYVRDYEGLNGKHILISQKPLENVTKEQLENSNLSLEVSNNDENLYYFGPTKSINLSSLLANTFSMYWQENSSGSMFQGRPFYLFEKSDGPEYVQVNRIALLKNYMLICHSNWLSKVQNILSESNYDLKDSDQINGIPKGWVVFENLIMLRQPNLKIENGMESLFPKQMTTAIEIVSGVDLGRGFWHTSQPIKISAVLKNKGFKFEIWDIQKNTKKSQTPLIDKNSANINFPPKEPADYRIKLLSSSNTELLDLDIYCRNADNPRPALLQKTELVYMTNRPSDLLTQQTEEIEVEEEKNSKEPTLKGLRLNLDVVDHPHLFSYEQHFSRVNVDRTNIVIPEEEQLESVEVSYSDNGFSLGAETCVIRGYHFHWLIGNRRYRNKQKEYKCVCKHCGYTFFGSNVPMQQNKPEINLEKKTTYKSFLSGARNDTFDERLDALCYLGFGSEATFQRIFDDPEKDALDVWKARRTLWDLSHVEFYLEKENFRPKKWQVLPPTIFITSNNSVCWSGFRSNHLAKQLDDAFYSLGASKEEQKIEAEFFSAHKWSAIEFGKLKEVIKNIKAPNGRELQLLEKPYKNLLKILPNINETFKDLPKLPSVQNNQGLFRFEPEKVKFVQANNDLQPGAYRVQLFGIYLYFFKDTDGLRYKGPVELIKLLGARLEKISYFEYSQESSEMSCPLGCDFPGIIRRILCANSGRMPLKRDGKLVYSEVASETAGTILERLR